MYKKVLSGLLAAVLAASLFSACGGSPAQADGAELAALALSPIGTVVTTVSDDSLTGEEIPVVLSDSGSSCGSSSVKISGSTITITAAGDYILSGSLSDGQILVDAPEDAKVRLILNGVSIIKNGHAAIYALRAPKAKFQNRLAACRLANPGRFGGN